MAIEIERKFLVTGKGYLNEATSQSVIRQGFLNLDPKRTVRVRIAGALAWLTIKGPSNQAGTTRFEWETPIEPAAAEELLLLTEGSVIEKKRYTVPKGNHLFEVDEFKGDNNGLVVAEVELSAEEDVFLKPEWLGAEVTGDIRYYNAQLSINPYKAWNHEN